MRRSRAARRISCNAPDFLAGQTARRMTVTPADGLFLHASSVAIAGGAVLFLGHSTSGKSTIARMLGPVLPVLADDSVYASRRPDGCWQVVNGGFRFGQAGVHDWTEAVQRLSAGAAGLRLLGCLRLRKAAELRMEPVSAIQLAKYLMDAAMEIDIQRKTGRNVPGREPDVLQVTVTRKLRRQWFRDVADMARRIPGWDLWFAKETPVSALKTTLLKLVDGS